MIHTLLRDGATGLLALTLAFLLTTLLLGVPSSFSTEAGGGGGGGDSGDGGGGGGLYLPAPAQGEDGMILAQGNDGMVLAVAPCALTSAPEGAPTAQCLAWVMLNTDFDLPLMESDVPYPRWIPRPPFGPRDLDTERFPTVPSPTTGDTPSAVVR